MPLEQKTWDDPQGPVLVLAGALDVRCTAELREVLYALITRCGGEAVVVDLSEVYAVDMTALKLLAVANRTAEARGGRVVLRGASIGIRRLLHLTHLRALVRMEPPTTPRTVPLSAPVSVPEVARGSGQPV